jgi:hypothetical protein
VFPSIRKRENPSDEPGKRFSENISRKSAPPYEANFLKSQHMDKLVIILSVDCKVLCFYKKLKFYKKKKRIR